MGEFCISLLHLSARSCPASCLYYLCTSLKQSTEAAEIQAPWWKHCLLLSVLNQTQTHAGSLICAEFRICLSVCVCVSLFYFPGWLRMSEPVAFHHLAAVNVVTQLFLVDQTLDPPLKENPPQPSCSNPPLASLHIYSRASSLFMSGFAHMPVVHFLSLQVFVCLLSRVPSWLLVCPKGSKNCNTKKKNTLSLSSCWCLDIISRQKNLN